MRSARCALLAIGVATLLGGATSAASAQEIRPDTLARVSGRPLEALVAALPGEPVRLEEVVAVAMERSLDLEAARAIAAQAIRYRSARDPRGVNLALFDPSAFRGAKPRIDETWHLRFVEGRLTALAAFPARLSFGFEFSQFGLRAP